MKFSHVTLSVENLEESINFYQDTIGLPLKNRFSPRPGVEIAFLGNGETAIELVCGQVKENAVIGQGISLGFEVESLTETMEFLHQKGIEAEVVQFNPQAKCLFISNADGVKIQIIGKVK